MWKEPKESKTLEDYLTKCIPIHEYSGYDNNDHCIICGHSRLFHVTNDIGSFSGEGWTNHGAYDRFFNMYPNLKKRS